MSGESEAYFTKDFERSFGEYRPEDEDLHPEYKAEKPHYALTETQYFSFNVPEHDIQAFLYMWVHPNLGLVSGGPMVIKGVKDIYLGAELFDYRCFLPESQLPRLSNYTLDNSYSVEMIEPGRVFRIRYDDPARGNSFDILFTAVSEPLVWPGSKHYEQVMHAKGELLLRGTRYEVDSHSVRDRSWGEARLEDPSNIPPVGWITGVFDGFAFNATCFDDPELGPFWKDGFPIDPAKTLKFGWAWRDGEKAPLISARALTHYDRASLLPQSIELEITDAGNRTSALRGTITAGAPLHPWLNIRTISALIRWEMDGKVGWGEVIQAQGTDFLQRYHQR